MTNQNKEYNMFDKEKFKRLILARKKLDDFDDFDDVAADKACKKIISYLCQNDEVFDEFVEYMKMEMIPEEYLYLSEISMYLSGIHPSLEFVEAFKGLEKKYPKETIDWKIALFIKDAEFVVEHFLKDKEMRIKHLKKWFDDDPDFIKPYL